MEYYSPIKKEILPYVVTEIDTEVKTQMLYNLTYIWILKKQTKLIEKGIRFLVTIGRGRWDGEFNEDNQSKSKN